MSTKTTTRVAVRAITGDDTDIWRIVEAPSDCIGSFDAEAHYIYPLVPEGSFRGHVVVVDADAEGMPQGCSTFSQFDEGEVEQARAEHWGCEHALFGGQTDIQDEYSTRWVQQTDEKELVEDEALELWSLRTGEYAEGHYSAIAVRYVWADNPDDWYITVWRDEHGPICEKVRIDGDRAEAFESATETIVECIEGF